MKHFKFVSLFMLLLVISCTKKSHIDKVLENLTINPDSFTKIDTAFYKNKNIESLKFYKNKNEYTNITFYESGNKKSLGHIKNNQCHDVYLDWYEDGTLKWERKYIEGNQIGESISYYKNGNRKQFYDNDKRETIDYNENGKIELLLSDKQQLINFYYTNGTIKEKYDSDKNNNIIIEIYNQNRTYAFKGISKNDKLYTDDKLYTGTIKSYFANGKISYFQDVLEGIKKGKYYSKYGNGNLRYEGEYANNREIYFKHYHENGKIDFIRDRKNGTFKSWDENGKPIE